MTYKEASEWIGKHLGMTVPDSRLRRAVKNGRIAYTKLGHRSVQITEQACRNFVNKRTVPA